MLKNVAVLGLLFLFSLPANAAKGVVVLKNGSRIHGELMEVLVDEYVSIKLADGTTRTFQWDEVDKIEEDSQREPPVEHKKEAVPAAPVQTDSATLHFESPKKQVEVRQITSQGMATAYGSNFSSATAFSASWEHLCATPCTFDLEPGNYQLQVAGGNVMPKDLFISVSAKQKLNYEVEPGSYMHFWGGMMLSTMGWTSAFLGGLYMLTMPESEHRGAHINLLIGGTIGGVFGHRMIKRSTTTITEK